MIIKIEKKVGQKIFVAASADTDVDSIETAKIMTEMLIIEITRKIGEYMVFNNKPK